MKDSRIEKTDSLPPHLIDVDFIKEVVPDFVTLKGIVSPYRLFRYDKADDRYYFRSVGGKMVGYLSVTSFVSKMLPTSPHLIKWMQKHGEDGSEYLKNLRAEYGTLSHIISTELEMSGKGKWEHIKQRAFNTAIELGYANEAMEWEAEMVNDILSYLIFRKERNVQTIACEFPICSDKYMLAGCIDRVVSLDFGRGTRVNAIIDYKSGRKGFWDSHIAQLHLYKKMWNDHFGDIFPVTHIFNLAPSANAIKAKTKYKLENQTDKSLSGESQPFGDSIEQFASMAVMRGMVNPPNSHFDIVGEFDIDSFDLEKHIVQTEI